MLNGCKSCSIFAIQDIELYFIFIAKSCKPQTSSVLDLFSVQSILVFLDPLTSECHKKIMRRSPREVTGQLVAQCHVCWPN